MRRYFCDRCQEEVDTKSFQYAYKYDSGLRGNKFTGELEKDFCLKCMKKVVAFIHDKEPKDANTD